MRSVQKSTWNWRARLAAAPAKDRQRVHLRRQAVIQTVVMVAIAALLRFVWGHQLMSNIVAGLAALFLLLGLFVPAAYARVHAFGALLGHGVGKVLLFLLMVPFYALFMTPVAIWLRLQGRDPMHRKFKDAEHTYWIPRLVRARGENIEKQFLRESRAARGADRPVGAVGWDGREGGR